MEAEPLPFAEPIRLLTELEEIVSSSGRALKSIGPNGARAVSCTAWTIHTMRLAFAVRRLLEENMPIEAIPIDRPAFEHAIRVLTVAGDKTTTDDGIFNVIARLEAVQTKKLRETHSIEEFPELHDLVALDVEVPEHQSAEAKALFNRLTSVEQT